MIKKILELLRHEKNNPESAVEFTIFEQATHFAKSGDYIRSIKYCEEILNVSPEADYYFELLKHCYFEIGDTRNYIDTITNQKKNCSSEDKRNLLDREQSIIEAASQGAISSVVEQLIEINKVGMINGWEFYKLAYKALNLANEEDAAQSAAQGQFFSSLNLIKSPKFEIAAELTYFQKRATQSDISKPKKVKSGFIIQDHFSVIVASDENVENPVYCCGDAEFLLHKMGSLTQSSELTGLNVVIANVPWGNEFAHWVFEVLPRVIWSIKNCKTIDKILLRKVSSWHVDYIEQLGLDTSKIFNCNDNIVYNFGQAMYFHEPSLTGPPFIIPKRAVTTLRKKFLSIKDTTKKPFAQRIFVNRKPKFGRNLTNNQEILDLLTRKGFIEIFPEDYETAVQINLFSSADIIVAVSGAACANTIFAKPTAHFIELAPASTNWETYEKIADLIGFKYNKVNSENHSQTVSDPLWPKLKNNEDILIEPKKLLAVLGET